MPALLNTFMRALAKIATSESGEFLSTRQKVEALSRGSLNKTSKGVDPASRHGRDK